MGPGRVVPCPTTRQTSAAALDPLHREVDRARSPAQGRVLVRLEVADAHAGLRDHRRLHGARRAEDDLPRPGQEPVGDLEGRVPLADDEDAPAAVVLRLATVDVVRDLLDPRDGRAPGRRHPEREDGRAAAVLAVARREHEAPVLVASRRLPRASVANLYGRPLGERGQALLHLRAGGNHERPVHERRDERLELGLIGDEAVVVVPLVLAGAGLRGRVRLRPGEEALEDGVAPEHPAGRLVPRDDGVLDARAVRGSSWPAARPGRCRRRRRGSRREGTAARPWWGASTPGGRGDDASRSGASDTSPAGTAGERSRARGRGPRGSGGPTARRRRPSACRREASTLRRRSRRAAAGAGWSSAGSSTAASPSRMTKRPPPESPRRRTRSPSEKRRSHSGSAIASRSGSRRSAKRARPARLRTSSSRSVIAIEATDRGRGPRSGRPRRRSGRAGWCRGARPRRPPRGSRA